MITGPDLATTTVEPHEFLAFLSGTLSRRFISGPETLDLRLSEVKAKRDFDTRFRVGDFFCQDDTWKMVLGRLARDSDVVLMDLRGFGPANMGCIYEINELLAAVPLKRLVLIVDRRTDADFLRKTLADGWAALPVGSVNRTSASPAVRLFQLAGRRDVPNLVRALAQGARD